MEHRDEVKGEHTKGRLEAFHNAGANMQYYSQSSGLHGVDDNRLKLICGCFKDIGGEEVAAANARRLAACWNACEGVSTQDIENFGESIREPMPKIGQLHAGVKADLAAARPAIEACAGVPPGLLHPGLVREQITEQTRLAADLAAARSELDYANGFRRETDKRLTNTLGHVDKLTADLAAAHALLAEVADELTTEGMDATVDRIRALLPKGGA